VKPRLVFTQRRTHQTSERLAPLVGCGARLDTEGLGSLLLQQAPLARNGSVYRDVTSAAHADVWGPLSLSRKAAPPAAPAGWGRVALRAAIVASIERAIEGASCVAVLASGGIDSACLLALTIEAARDVPVVAVALDFASDGDDRPHLEALEKSLRCEVVRVAPEAGARHVALVRHGVDEAPFVWPFSPAQVALYEAARARGADRILTGAGGDHLFDGDPRWLADELFVHPLEAIACARRLRDFDHPRSPALTWLVRPHIARAVPTAWRRRRALRTAGDHHARAWAGPRLEAMIDAFRERRLAMDLAPAPRGDIDAWFSDPDRRYICWSVHQEQIAGGIDRRDPYFERSIAAFMASLPATLIFDQQRRRGLLREALRGRVPDSVLDRSDKADFGPAFARFFAAAGGLDAFVEERRGRALAELGLVDRGRFESAIARAFSEAEAHAAYGYAWGALAVEAFLLRHPELWS
jgi:asparagine synthetase B (glutamine-hydrolysing)